MKSVKLLACMGCLRALALACPGASGTVQGALPQWAGEYQLTAAFL